MNLDAQGWPLTPLATPVSPGQLVEVLHEGAWKAAIVVRLCPGTYRPYMSNDNVQALASSNIPALAASPADKATKITPQCLKAEHIWRQAKRRSAQSGAECRPIAVLQLLAPSQGGNALVGTVTEQMLEDREVRNLFDQMLVAFLCPGNLPVFAAFMY